MPLHHPLEGLFLAVNPLRTSIIISIVIVPVGRPRLLPSGINGECRAKLRSWGHHASAECRWLCVLCLVLVRGQRSEGCCLFDGGRESGNKVRAALHELLLAAAASHEVLLGT